MTDDPAEEFVHIDRCALVVRPTWKFAEWVNSLDAEPIEDETEIQIHTVYLVEYAESLDIATTADLLDSYFVEIAASEFGAWWTDESDWPPIRSLNDFFQYFECTPSETVIDLAAASDGFEEPAEEY